MWFADTLTAALVDAGLQSVLISGGPVEPVSLFARRFHATVGGALTLEQNENDCFTGRVALNAGLPAEKRRIAVDYAANGNIRFAAGDTPNDKPLLERAQIKLIVGNAIDPPASWTNVYRLPPVPTREARRQLAALIRALGRPQIVM
jgi:phosphoserine phosphatase